MDFHERLLALLNERGLKQVDLCQLTGLSSAQANHLVNGKTKDPRLSTAAEIAKALNVSLDWLAGLKPSQDMRLSPEESELVGNYRSSSPPNRQVIAQSARNAALASGEASERTVDGAEGVSA